MLVLMELSLFTLVLSFRLGLADDGETFLFELPDLLFSEVSHLRLRVRTFAILLTLLLGGRSFFSVFGSVLTFLSTFLSLLAVISVLSSSVVLSVIPVSVVALLVIFLLSWLLLSLGRLGLRGLSERSGLSFHCNNRGFFHFLSHDWSFRLHWLRLRSCDNHWSDNWSRFRHSNNWCGWLGHHNKFRLDLYLLFQDITDNFFLVADNRNNLVISIFLNICSDCFLQFSVVCKVLE